MSKAAVHGAWAPAGGRWSPWVKPVLFASLDDDEAAASAVSVPWLRRACFAPLERQVDPYREHAGLDDVAIVVDLPGADGIWVGAALVALGFRPIPLYNALPHAGAIVDVRPIMRALAGAATVVAAAPADGPPAFLLDADRMAPGRRRERPYFDNRSFCFESDFPSAAMLRDAGIRQAVAIGGTVAADVHGVLGRWRAAGIELWQLAVGGARVEPLALRRVWLRRTWHAVTHPGARRDTAFGIWREKPAAG